MTEHTKTTPPGMTIAQIQGFSPAVRNALTQDDFRKAFARDTLNAMQSFELFAAIPNGLAVYSDYAVKAPNYAMHALNAITKHQDLPAAAPLLFAIAAKYPGMVRNSANKRAIESPEVIAAMVRGLGKVDIDTGASHEDRVRDTLASFAPAPNAVVQSVTQKGGLSNVVLPGQDRGTRE